MIRRTLSLIVAPCIVVAGIAPAMGHPHVFPEARLEVVVNPHKTVQQLRHVWRFDDLFSSTVLVEFDANADLKLDAGELDQVAETVTASLAEFNYFQNVEADGKTVEMSAPTDLRADFADNQLLIFFTSSPKQPLPVAANPSFGVFDPTFYTAIEFADDDQMVLVDAPSSCSKSVFTPDPDEALAQNQATLTEAFFEDPDGNNLAKIFATRMNVKC